MFQYETSRNDMTLDKGDTMSQTFQVSGVEFASGDVVVFSLRAPGSDWSAVSKSLTPDAGGKVTVTLTNAESGALAVGRYKWDLCVRTGKSGNVWSSHYTPLVRGYFTVREVAHDV